MHRPRKDERAGQWAALLAVGCRGGRRRKKRAKNSYKDERMKKEKQRMEDYKFEYFILNIGEASFKGEGSSLKKSTTNIQRKGTSYKIFGCGYLERGLLNEIDILVPLETILVLSS